LLALLAALLEPPVAPQELLAASLEPPAAPQELLAEQATPALSAAVEPVAPC